MELRGFIMKYKNFDKKIHELNGEEILCIYCGESLELTPQVQKGQHTVYVIAACDCDDITAYLGVEAQITTLRDQIATLEATKPLPDKALMNQKRYDKELAKLKKRYNIED